jgi:hypothetical protein
MTASGLRPDPGGPSASDSAKQAVSLEEWVELMSREFQQTLAILTAKQASIVESLIAEERNLVFQAQAKVKEPSRQSHNPARGRTAGRVKGDRDVEKVPASEEVPADRVEIRLLDPLLQSAQSFATPSIPQPIELEELGRRTEIAGDGNSFSSIAGKMAFIESAPAAPLAGVAERLERVTRERDEAWAECARLREEARDLRSGTATHLAEIARLRENAEKLSSLRAERDRLNADRELMAREANQLQARLVELQVTLVETEAELDESRNWARAEQLEWQERCEAIRVEGNRRLAEQRGEFEVERQAWIEQLAIHRKVEHEARTLQVKVKKLRDLYDATRQERDDAYRRIETLGQRCSRLSAYLDEAEAERSAADRSHQAEVERLSSALAEALEAAESALRRNGTRVQEVRRYQAELAEQGREPALSLQPQAHSGDPD